MGRFAFAHTKQTLLLGCVATPIPGWVDDMRPTVDARTIALLDASAERAGVPVETRDASGHFSLRPVGAPEGAPFVRDRPYVRRLGEHDVVTCFAACVRRAGQRGRDDAAGLRRERPCRAPRGRPRAAALGHRARCPDVGRASPGDHGDVGRGPDVCAGRGRRSLPTKATLANLGHLLGSHRHPGCVRRSAHMVFRRPCLVALAARRRRRALPRFAAAQAPGAPNRVTARAGRSAGQPPTGHARAGRATTSFRRTMPRRPPPRRSRHERRRSIRRAIRRSSSSRAASARRTTARSARARPRSTAKTGGRTRDPSSSSTATSACAPSSSTTSRSVATARVDRRQLWPQPLDNSYTDTNGRARAGPPLRRRPGRARRLREQDRRPARTCASA